MTPVINPWVFYLMPVCENVSFLAWTLFILGAIAAGVIGLIWFIAAPCDDEICENTVRILKKLIPIVLVIAFIACLIPSEETITKMLIAQNVTYERVDVVADTVANVYNDIMNLFQDSGAANG